MTPKDYATLLASEVLATIAQEAEFTFARSSGPGGQNVNKVESKVLLRWNLNTTSLPLDTCLKLKTAMPSFITLKNELLLTSDRFRDQARNKADVLEKLEALLVVAFTPRKARKPTRPGKRAKERRRESKKHQSEKKSSRQRIRH